jgi:hypothetical protein
MTSFTSSEFPNFQSLNKLIANWNDLDLTQDQRKDIKIQDKSYSLLSILKNYKKSRVKGSIPIEYKYSKGNPTFPGRQFSQSASMQGMKRWIRHTLATGYYDYDMVNCHPTLFVQLCKKKGWDTTPFESYLEKRDEYLKELMDTNALDRDEAKEIVLSILNGGVKSYKALAFKPMWLTNYKNAVEEVQLEILGDPENTELLKTIKKHKTYNLGGSIMNCLLCEIENKCLMEAIKILEVKDPILCFDGFMSKQLYDVEQLGSAIYLSTGYQTTWLIKSMNEGIDLSKFDEKQSEEEDNSNLGVYKEVLEAFPNYIKKKGSSVFIFNEKNGMWYQDRDSFGIWMNMCEDVGWGNELKIMRETFALTQKLDDSTSFFEKATKARLGKLLYSDCIRDIENHISIPFSPDYFFTLRIDRPFPKVPNEVNITKVFQSLYIDPHESEEVRNELWKTISMGMTGRNVERGYSSCIAPTRCGKSTMINTYINSHSPYVNSISAQTFISSKFTKSNDHNDNLLLLKDTRLLFASEKPGSGLIDSELMKGVTGNDKMSARACGQKAEASFYTESYLVFMGNSPLQFDNKDLALQSRNKSIRWKKQFPVSSDKSVELFLKSEEAKEAMDYIVERGIKLYQKEGFIKVSELEEFTAEINEEDDHFLNKLEEVFDLDVGNSDNQDTWILGTTVYKIFKSILKTEYEIKERFKEQGVICGRLRKSKVDEVKNSKGEITTHAKPGDVNPKCYFKGLIFKPQGNLTITNDI